MAAPQPVPTATHTYAAAGTYTVTMTATDAVGNTTTRTATTSITAAPPALAVPTITKFKLTEKKIRASTRPMARAVAKKTKLKVGLSTAATLKLVFKSKHKHLVKGKKKYVRVVLERQAARRPLQGHHQSQAQRQGPEARHLCTHRHGKELLGEEPQEEGQAESGPMTRTHRRSALLAAASLIVGLAAVSAEAAPSWVPAGPVGPAFANGFVGTVAVDSNGNAVALWSASDGS